MLKYAVSITLCVFALLSACEPNGSETMEPVSEQPSGIPPATGNGDLHDDFSDLDSNAIGALAEVNAWRQKGCGCGDVTLPPTTKVTWNDHLYQAALAHAQDMSTNNYFSHTSPSGENVYDRLMQSGYVDDGRTLLVYGENIAFGDFDLTEAVQKWLDSPSHCANLMRDSYREMAIAHVDGYWVQVFGATRN